ncbi:MAG: PilZ domain-containing protein [Myxococcales bacterium]
MEIAAIMDWQDNGAHGQRRRFARRPVQLPAKLQIGGRELSAVTENISPGGAFLRVKLPETAKEIVATIGLPHGKNLRVRAKIRWRRPNPPGVGVEFETFLADLSAPA